MKYCVMSSALFLIGLMLPADSLWAGPCVTVEGVAVNTVVTPEDFAGSGTLTIDGVDRSFEIEGINLGFTELEDNGTQRAVTATDWRVQDSGIRFTSIEDASLSPTDTPEVFDYLGRSVIKTGIGRFNCGEMIIKGVVDFDGGTASFPELRGKLCRCN